MPYQRPTLQELTEQQSVDISYQFNIPQSQVPRSNVGIYAKVQAGGLHGLHGHLQYLVNQQFEDVAEAEYLKRRANIREISQKKATKAAGYRVINGTNGVAVTAGEILQRADGQQFRVLIGATIAAGTGSIEVEALESGALGNTDEAEQLTFVTPIAGIESTSPTGQLSGGTDPETDEQLRARVLADIREPPHGGADHDYVKWVKETPGVNVHRVWVIRKWMGRGTVGVFFTVDNGAIPDAANVALVQAHIEAEAQVTGDKYIVAPTAAPVDIEISGLSPNTPAVRAAAEAELVDLFMRSANVEDGNNSGKIPLSHIREAISVASGEDDHVVESPTTNPTFNPGELPQLGVVTWT